MDKAQAIHAFWSQFGWKAYDENSVPTGADAPKPPYITYNVTIDSLDRVVNLSASLWDRSSSWARVSQKAEEIAKNLAESWPISKEIDNGRVYFAPGYPFAQRMSDEDDMIKRIYINVQAEFLTAY